MITNKLLGAGGAGGINIADLFNTTLYVGDATATRVITTGIDLSANEGVVWFRNRSNSGETATMNTITGATKYLDLGTTNSVRTDTTFLQSFNATGVTIGNDLAVNRTGNNIAVCSIVSAEGFFDVLEYAGTGITTTQNIAHNLNMVPGAILVKMRTGTGSTEDDWYLYHRSLNGGTSPEDYHIPMADAGSAQVNSTTIWNSTAPTDSVFSVGANSGTNKSPGTYVAYLFGHDTSGGGVIQCGGYVGNGLATGPVVTLGWEPQWLLIKPANNNNSGITYDNVRSPSNPRTIAARLFESNSDNSTNVNLDFTSTGFQPKIANLLINGAGESYVYIAIRKAN